MARKTAADLKHGQLTIDGAVAESIAKKAKKDADKSWAALGVDTSMTSVAVVGIGYDAKLDKMVGPSYAEMRWYPDDDYFMRLGQAAKGHDLVLEVLKVLWVIKPENVHIAIEEPFYYGAVKKAQSSYLKQQAEICGSFKGSLARYGMMNLYEINNSQWAKTLRDEGVPLLPQNKKDPDKKWKVKAWAISAFGLPDLPDLVKSKSGAKIPRPESGRGANAKAEQPNDIYDAAACCAWMVDEMERTGIIDN